MRRLFLMLVCCLALYAGEAHAQRYLPKMQGIELRGGAVDGFKGGDNFYSGIALSTYTKGKDRWIVGAEYLQKEYSYKDIAIPKSQFTGEGELRLDDGTVFIPNDRYILDREVFRLYYTSHCTDQQSIDIYIEDNFGQEQKYTFTFQNETVAQE